MNNGFEGSSVSGKSIPRQKGMASPWDRVAAFVVDVVFLFPFVQILQAPLKRQITTASLLEIKESVIGLELGLLGVLIFSFVTYRASCHYFFGKTLGKRIFGLQIQHAAGKRSFFAMVMRSFVLLGEFLVAGWPLFSVFFHYRRRPWHDRISDTYVVSHRNMVSPPIPSEQRKGYLAGAVVLMGFLIVTFMVPARTLPEPENGIQKADVSEDCEIFMESSDGSVVRAIEAFSVHNIDGDCLRHISSEALWRDEEALYANLGNAFAEAQGENSSSRMYKDEVCRLDPESTPCSFVHWTDTKPLESHAHFEDIVSILKRRDAEDFYRIFFVTALHAHGEYEQASEVLQSVKDPERLTETMASATFENLMWRGQWEAGYWVFKLKKLKGDEFSKFVELAVDKKKFGRKKLKTLIEKFYPNLETAGRTRGLASEDQAPAAMKMLWIRLSGEK